MSQTVWFGANDCSRLEQYVPLDRFKANLKEIITHPLVNAQSPHVILFTNPPVEETLLLEMNKENGRTEEIRKAKDAAAYAEAVREVGREMGVPVLDVWTAFMDAAGWKGGEEVLPESSELGKNEVLADLMYDGEVSLEPLEDRRGADDL